MRIRATLRRLLVLWRLYAYLDLLWVARDVVTCAAFMATDAVLAIAGLTSSWLLAARFGGIGPWRLPQIIFLLGYAQMATGVTDLLFNFNLSFISRRIGRGQLDHILVQPQPLWMILLTEGFTPISGCLGMAPGLALLGWSVARTGVALTPEWLALLALNLLASTVIALAFTYVVGSVAFWAPRAAEEINTSSWALLSQLKPFPLDGAAPALLGGLLSVVPVGLLAWYPCRALLGLDRAGYAVFVTPVVAVVAAAIATWVFRRGLEHYGHTGSQRYLAYGHRR
jgi:ABC-2 type transport system permease protein